MVSMNVSATNLVVKTEEQLLLERWGLNGENGLEEWNRWGDSEYLSRSDDAYYDDSSFAENSEDPDYIPLHNWITKQTAQKIQKGSDTFRFSTRLLESSYEIFQMFVKSVADSKKVRTIEFTFHRLDFSNDSVVEKWNECMNVMSKNIFWNRLLIDRPGLSLVSERCFDSFRIMLERKSETLVSLSLEKAFTTNYSHESLARRNEYPFLDVNKLFSVVGEMKALTHLDISENYLSVPLQKMVLSSLWGMKSLTSVKANSFFTVLDTSNIDLLFRCRLKTICISHTVQLWSVKDEPPYDSSWLESLSKDRYIEHLDVSHTDLGYGNEFKSREKLLSLKNIPFDRLVSALRLNKSLTSINLSKNGLGTLNSERIKSLCLAIINHNSIESIDLSYDITLVESKEYLQMLGNMVYKTPRLIELNLFCFGQPFSDYESYVMTKEKIRLLVQFNRSMISYAVIKAMENRIPIELTRIIFSFLREGLNVENSSWLEMLRRRSLRARTTVAPTSDNGNAVTVVGSLSSSSVSTSEGKRQKTE